MRGKGLFSISARRLGLVLGALALVLQGCGPAAAARKGTGFGFRLGPSTTITVPATSVSYDTAIGSGVDTNGFASLPLRVGAKAFFVNSSSGNDSRTCTQAQTASTPLLTVAAGVACITQGAGDQVLLAEGSSFAESLPWLAFKGGFSATYPTVISTYDPADPSNAAKYGRGDQRSARPVLNPGGALVSGGPFSYLAIKGLDFNPGNIPGQGLTFSGDGSGGTGGASYVLLENNIFRYSGLSFLDGGDGLHAPLDQHVIIRNNSIYGIYTNSTQHVGGIYADGLDGLTIEDNVIWHTGWKIGGSRDDDATIGGPTIFNHPIYLQANDGVSIVRRNLMADNAADGGIGRGSNIVWQQNVAIKSPNGFGLGPGNSVDFDAQLNGTLVDASYNLSVGAVDLATGSPRGQAFSTANLAPGSRIHHNLMIYSAATPGSADQAIATTGGTAYSHASAHTFTEFEFNTAFHWSASGFAFSEASTPIHTLYTHNIWDNPASGTNVNSGTPTFSNAYTQAGLYTAAGVTDYATLVSLASNHPEAHYQRTLLTTAFAGYGMATSPTDTTAPTLSAATGTATGTGTATIGVTTNDATGDLYYELLTAATATNTSRIKMGVDGSNVAGVSPGSLAISSSGSKSINLSGLVGGTYFAHFTHEDAAGNKSLEAVSSSFTVAGVTFATWNPADMSGSGMALTGGSLIATTSGGAQVGVRGTKAITAKAYWEVNVSALADGWAAGIADTSASFTGSYWGNGGNSHVYAPFAASPGQTIMFAVDPVAKLVWRGVNGVWTGDPVAGTGGTSFAAFTGSAYPAFQGDSGDIATANFGQSAYTYTPPTGFSSMMFLPLFSWRRRRSASSVRITKISLRRSLFEPRLPNIFRYPLQRRGDERWRLRNRCEPCSPHDVDQARRREGVDMIERVDLLIARAIAYVVHAGCIRDLHHHDAAWVEPLPQRLEHVERIVQVLEHLEHRDRVKGPRDLLELCINTHACAGATSVGPIDADGVKTEQATHFEEFAKAAAEIEHSPDAEVLEPQDMLNIASGVLVAAMLRFELADCIFAHPLGKSHRVPFWRQDVTMKALPAVLAFDEGPGLVAEDGQRTFAPRIRFDERSERIFVEAPGRDLPEHLGAAGNALVARAKYGRRNRRSIIRHSRLPLGARHCKPSANANQDRSPVWFVGHRAA